MKGAIDVLIDASPEAVYTLVADVTRIGDFSPECRGSEACPWLVSLLLWLDLRTRSAGNPRIQGQWDRPSHTGCADLPPGERSLHLVVDGIASWHRTAKEGSVGTRSC